MNLNRSFDGGSSGDCDDFYSESQRWLYGLLNAGLNCFSSYNELYYCDIIIIMIIEYYREL